MTPWMIHAAKAVEMSRHVLLHHDWFERRASAAAHGDGRAASIAGIGRPRTISGAATSIKISCCVMWAEKRTAPHGCSGETNATKSESQPAAKQPASHFLMPWPAPP